MLARANRVIEGVDFKSTVRSGRRASSANAVVYCARVRGDHPTRFGFIVSKAVGNSVTRNLVRRRLRAVSRELLPSLPAGCTVVVRPLPGSAALSFSALRDEVSESIHRSAAQS